EAAFALTGFGAARKHRRPKAQILAQMAELVDALVSGTSAARRGGSSPLLGTNKNSIKTITYENNDLYTDKILQNQSAKSVISDSSEFQFESANGTLIAP